ncbi:hypothetical protein BV898_13550 [Hypsibius exemplaris]|uniref:Uncharacterized protein n=1 Tax=Hypsibius exemplaris TaxID=2072580 RepID=A0A1W0WAK3_HYPEX|nr:hypothetical protein BV898_13550 [Hypsibius exemplaris]
MEEKASLSSTWECPAHGKSRNATGEDDTIVRRDGSLSVYEDTAMLFQEFALRSSVWAMNNGKWHSARVMRREEGVHPDGRVVPLWKIHYHKWAARWDEFLMGNSIMLKNPETDARAAMENATAPTVPQSKMNEMNKMNEKPEEPVAPQGKLVAMWQTKTKTKEKFLGQTLTANEGNISRLPPTDVEDLVQPDPKCSMNVDEISASTTGCGLEGSQNRFASGCVGNTTEAGEAAQNVLPSGSIGTAEPTKARRKRRKPRRIFSGPINKVSQRSRNDSAKKKVASPVVPPNVVVGPPTIRSELSAMIREIHCNIFEDHRNHPVPLDNKRAHPPLPVDHNKSVPTCRELLEVYGINAAAIPAMSVEEVAGMLVKLFGERGIQLGDLFQKEQIDGESLLLLDLARCVGQLNMPIGPALTLDGIFKLAREVLAEIADPG